MAATYRGRFAPSPTGPLHFGSLVAAVGSYLEARVQGGEWLVRIEDLDEPRSVPGAGEGILRTLERFGFEWDGAVVWQSRRHGLYQEALEWLRRVDAVFPCACSRRELAGAAAARDGSALYPGTCRRGLPAGRQPRAWRLRVGPEVICFGDSVQGLQCQDLETEVGDFVVFRADGQYAYQLAVVVDDADQGVTHVVRGADLLDSTPRQIWVQSRLDLPQVAYAHLPVVLDEMGDKLSKQTLAAPVDGWAPAVALDLALEFLGQTPPPGLQAASPGEVWRWAMAHWRLSSVPRQRGAKAPAPVLQAESGNPAHANERTVEGVPGRRGKHGG